ncbi:uncharacterized protein MELLADRAFT_78678 [Melampsora larici-populina 98AG31]|uniref:Uncharacterized protein n=1 Tax=Melampsora larici-populina (strain 98AG31 / pathotype 3-4-7) TaxID=747676 RepID=F4RX77_MELLP|nr:uncharacterized protein MELLADRAFT_78678 [Melampsora larici-populina 98AG31]EGG03037.1 hypothetical protein MELLADRAFT_78678 [Melampsora larici-populina 98AG31]
MNNALQKNGGVGPTDDRLVKDNDVVMVNATTTDNEPAVNRSGKTTTNEHMDMNSSKLVGEWKITLNEENSLPIETLQRIWSVMKEAVQLGIAIPIQKKDDLQQTTQNKDFETLQSASSGLPEVCSSVIPVPSQPTKVSQNEHLKTLQPASSGLPETCGSAMPTLSRSQPKKVSKSLKVPTPVTAKSGQPVHEKIKDLKNPEASSIPKKVVIDETESLGDQIRRLSSQLPKPSTQDLLNLQEDEEDDESQMSDEPEDEDEESREHPSLKRSNGRRYDSSEDEDSEEEEGGLPLNPISASLNVASGLALNPTTFGIGVEEDEEDGDDEEAASTPNAQGVPIVQQAAAPPTIDIFTQRSPRRSPEIRPDQTARVGNLSCVKQVTNLSPTSSKLESSQTADAITLALDLEREEGLESLCNPGRIKPSISDLSPLTTTKDKPNDSAHETSLSHDSSSSPILTAPQSSPEKVKRKLVKPSNITTAKSQNTKISPQGNLLVEAKDDYLSRKQTSPTGSSARLSSHPPITTSRVQTSDEESESEEENVMATRSLNKLPSHGKLGLATVSNHKPDTKAGDSPKSIDTDEEPPSSHANIVQSNIAVQTPQVEEQSSDEESSSDEDPNDLKPPPSAQKVKTTTLENISKPSSISSRTQEMTKDLKESRPTGSRRKTLNSFKPDDFEVPITVLNQKPSYPATEPIESSSSDDDSDDDSSDGSDSDKEQGKKTKEIQGGLPISKMAGAKNQGGKKKRKSMIDIWKLETAKIKKSKI